MIGGELRGGASEMGDRRARASPGEVHCERRALTPSHSPASRTTEIIWTVNNYDFAALAEDRFDFLASDMEAVSAWSPQQVVDWMKGKRSDQQNRQMWRANNASRKKKA